MKIGNESTVTRLELSKPAFYAFQTDGNTWKELNDDFQVTKDMIRTIETKIKSEYERNY